MDVPLPLKQWSLTPDEMQPRVPPQPVTSPERAPQSLTLDNEAAIALALTQMADAIKEVNTKLDSKMTNVLERLEQLETRLTQLEAPPAFAESKTDVVEEKAVEKTSASSKVPLGLQWPPRYSGQSGLLPY